MAAHLGGAGGGRVLGLAEGRPVHRRRDRRRAVGSADGTAEGLDVGTLDSVGASVGAAEMVGAAVVGMGVGWQAPSVFLTPQVPPLAPVLKMQGE